MRAARLLLVACLVALAAAASANAGSMIGPGTTIDTGTDYNGGKALPFAKGTLQKARAAARLAGPSAGAAAIGDQRTWLALDDAFNVIYFKNYTLRGIGDHIEVWVASDSDVI